MLGIWLINDEDVHHINGVKIDNRVENLQVISKGDHARLENSMRDYSSYKKHEYSEEERQVRSDRAKQLHKEGRMMTPQARAALAKARGEA